MKKGVVLLISAIAFGGIIGTSLTSCNSTQSETIQGATVQVATHGDLVSAKIDNEKESYKKGDKISLTLTFKEGYGLSEILINGNKAESEKDITLEAGKNVIEIYAKNLVITDGTTNIRDFTFEDLGGKYAITSYTPTGIYPSIAEFPSTYLGKPVTEIRFLTKTTSQDGFEDTIVISRYLFGGLKGVKIPASIEKIAPEVFRSNSSLTSITVDENNKKYSSDGTVLLNKDKTKLIAFPQGVEGEYKVPDSVKEIGNHAFFGCQKITKIDLNKVEKLGEKAFYSTKRIKEFIIPDTVTSIGKECFSTSVEVEKITLSKNLTVIPESCFYKNTSLKEINIPSSVKNIEKFAFYESVKLENVTFNEGLNSIGDSAFALTSIKEANFPASLTTIGKSSFSGISRLSKVTFKEGITSIGENSFYRNLKLESINIPASLKSIGQGSFFAGLSLKGFDVADTNPSYSDIDGVLFSKDGTELIAYPSAKGVNKEGFITEDKTTYVIPEGTTKLGFQCFSAVSNNPDGESDKSYSIKKVVIPTSVKEMDQPFYLAKLDEVEYKGTTQEFKAIKQGEYAWNYEASIKKHVCSGDNKQ